MSRMEQVNLTGAPTEPTGLSRSDINKLASSPWALAARILKWSGLGLGSPVPRAPHRNLCGEWARSMWVNPATNIFKSYCSLFIHFNKVANKWLKVFLVCLWRFPINTYTGNIMLKVIHLLAYLTALYLCIALSNLIGIKSVSWSNVVNLKNLQPPVPPLSEKLSFPSFFLRWINAIIIPWHMARSYEYFHMN